MEDGLYGQNGAVVVHHVEKVELLGVVIWIVEFSGGGQKLERFLPKNQHTQRKLLEFEFWINGAVKNRASFY